jgi:regulatory protein
MSQILSVAIKQLSDRNCSERDLRRHLEKEFVALQERDKRIDESIARLRELHLINDNRVCSEILISNL